MPRKATPRTSRGTEPDEQPPKYRLRKRTSDGTVSDGKNLEDDNHQTLAKRTKRTATNTCAQSSFSRGSVKKRRNVSWRQGWAQKNKNREWLAEAILEENDTQYLIEYEPVSEGVQREISWQPKHYANAALARDWEERKMASAHENSNAERDNDPALTKKEDGAGRRRSLVAYDGQPQTPITDHQSLEQYGTESEDSQQCSADLVDKRTSGGFEETCQDTPFKATSPIILEILDILVPERNIPVAHMYESAASKNRGAASTRPCVKVGGNLSIVAENNHRCDEHELRDDVATKVKPGRSQPKYSKVASSTAQHLESSESVQHLRAPNEKKSVNAMIADDSRTLRSFLVDAATADVSQSRKDCTSVQDVYGAQPNSCGQAEGLEQVPEGHVAKRDGHGRPSPRPDTSISTILSQAPSTLPNFIRDNESVTFGGKDSGQASPRTLAHVEVSKNRDLGVSGAVSGKLASARKQLRILLRGPGRRRFRNSSLRFPPSP
jgi:hypothetical protein